MQFLFPPLIFYRCWFYVVCWSSPTKTKFGWSVRRKRNRAHDAISLRVSSLWIDVQKGTSEYNCNFMQWKSCSKVKKRRKYFLHFSRSLLLSVVVFWLERISDCLQDLIIKRKTNSSDQIYFVVYYLHWSERKWSFFFLLLTWQRTC